VGGDVLNNFSERLGSFSMGARFVEAVESDFAVGTSIGENF